MIRNVLVTSGGTSEPIDSIRSITNKSTGKLGSLIAEGFSARESVEKVYYLHGKGAILPSSDKMIPIEIETVSELLSAVKELFKNTSIDAVVHAMAVSDYRVRSVSSAEDVLPLAQRASSVSEFKAALAGADLRDEGTKISSDLESPVLLLERTPKILPLFRKLAPEALIIGFKLLSGVSNQSLIDTAIRLLMLNGCDYVFANDFDTVSSGRHEGFLISSNRYIYPLAGKENIAKEIVQTVLGAKTR